MKIMRTVRKRRIIGVKGIAKLDTEGITTNKIKTPNQKKITLLKNIKMLQISTRQSGTKCPEIKINKLRYDNQKKENCKRRGQRKKVEVKKEENENNLSFLRPSSYQVLPL